MIIPTPKNSQIKAPGFITYRRLWLDTILESLQSEMRGTVVDLGGKRENKRGSFQPPENLANGWWYINLDLSTRPDIFADVTSVPLENESVDMVICTEVLEHLQNPASCCQEVYRILRVGGKAIFSVPFLYPVHADPDDYQRFTADGLRLLLKQFESLNIIPMGGYLGTVAMLMEIGLPGTTGAPFSKKILRRVLNWTARKFYAADLNRSSNQPAMWSNYTTGYFVKAVK